MQDRTAPFRLTTLLGGRRLGPLAPALERALGLDRLDALCARAEGGAAASPRAFVSRALAALGVAPVVGAGDRARLPARGPALVVANHPRGLLDGLLLLDLLLGLRPDVKLVANELLSSVAPLASVLVPVDTFAPAGAPENVRALRAAHDWLAAGHVVALFPAGTVSHLQLRRLRVLDPVWSEAAAWLARRTGAPVVPAHLPGRNGALFQAAGLLHPRLRTALLPRALLATPRRPARVVVGGPVPAERVTTAGLRARVELLGRRTAPPPAAAPAGAPVAPPVAPERLAAEVRGLGPEAALATQGDLAVLLTRRERTPALLDEVGRLREVTFRAIGAGTGRARDLDAFDDDYEHLVLWDRGAQAVLGAYRVARVHETLARRGVEGLYTSTLFRYDPAFFDGLGPALELGRSFVRREAQRAHAPLQLLWRGLLALLRAEGRSHLLGSVTVSARYQPASLALIARHLEARRDPVLAARVAPRRAPTLPPLGVEVDVGRLEALDEHVRDLEPDGAGAPVLLRRYLELGASHLALNVDPAFGEALDALLLLDARRGDAPALTRLLRRLERPARPGLRSRGDRRALVEGGACVA